MIFREVFGIVFLIHLFSGVVTQDYVNNADEQLPKETESPETSVQSDNSRESNPLNEDTQSVSNSKEEQTTVTEQPEDADQLTKEKGDAISSEEKQQEGVAEPADNNDNPVDPDNELELSPSANSQAQTVTPILRQTPRNTEKSHSAQKMESTTKHHLKHRDSFETSMVKAHNRLRRLHCVGPLKRSRSLATSAQAWANELARRNYLKPNPHNRKGQNCSWRIYKDGRMATGSSVTQRWYNEISLYNFNSPKFDHATGHFTQLIWKRSRYIGIGKARAKDGGWFYVANYSPIGNTGRYAENVLRPSCH